MREEIRCYNWFQWEFDVQRYISPRGHDAVVLPWTVIICTPMEGNICITINFLQLEFFLYRIVKQPKMCTLKEPDTHPEVLDQLSASHWKDTQQSCCPFPDNCPICDEINLQRWFLITKRHVSFYLTWVFTQEQQNLNEPYGHPWVCFVDINQWITKLLLRPGNKVTSGSFH